MTKHVVTFIGVALFAFMHLAASATTTSQLYAVIFGVTVGENGELISLRVDKVIDPQSRSTEAVDIVVPESYVASARELVLARKYEPKIRDGKAVEFFTWFYFDPTHPTRADIRME